MCDIPSFFRLPKFDVFTEELETEKEFEAEERLEVVDVFRIYRQNSFDAMFQVKPSGEWNSKLNSSSIKLFFKNHNFDEKWEVAKHQIDKNVSKTADILRIGVPEVRPWQQFIVTGESNDGTILGKSNIVTFELVTALID